MDLAALPFTLQDLGWVSFAAAVLLSALLAVRVIAAMPWRGGHAAQPVHVPVPVPPEPSAQPAGDRVATHL